MRYILGLVISSLFVLPLGCDSDASREKKAPPFARGKQTAEGEPGNLSVSEKELVRDSLKADGVYECCTKPECLACVEERGRCSCYADIAKKDPICGECLEGYKKGNGRLKLISIPELEQARNKRKE